MTKEEALQMALKFIERVNQDGWVLADFEPEMYACITAIKEALETKDDPVAIVISESGADVTHSWWHEPALPIGTKLYTSPQRTWVGLNNEDMKDERTHNFDFIHGARWAEDKLKEKNT
jgi:hypothetical protein